MLPSGAYLLQQLLLTTFLYSHRPWHPPPQSESVFPLWRFTAYSELPHARRSLATCIFCKIIKGEHRARARPQSRISSPEC